MKSAVFLQLLQLILLLLCNPPAAHSNSQESEAVTGDACAQTVFAQLSMFGLLEDVGAEIKQIHTEASQKHDNIRSVVTEGHSDIVSLLKQTNADTILSTENLISIVRRSEQLVQQISTDMNIIKSLPELQQTENALVDCGRELEQVRTNLNETQAQHTNSKTQLENTKVTLERTLIINADLKQKLAQNEAELTNTKASLEQQLFQTETKLGNVKVALDQKNTANVVLEQQLSQTEAELGNIKIALKQLNTTKAVLEQQYSEITAILETSKADLQEKLTSIVTLEQQLSQNEAELGTTKDALEQKSIQNAALQQQLYQTEGELRRMKVTLDQQIIQNVNQEQQLSQTEGELRRMKVVLDQKISQNINLEQQLSQAQAELGNTKAELQELKSKCMDDGCSAPFESVPRLGCVYASPRSEQKTWHSAGVTCRNLGAHLYVGHGRNTMEALGQYIHNKYRSGRGVWVGVQGRRWLDGVHVTREEWSIGQPNGGLEECAGVDIAQQLLVDVPCRFSGQFICQLD